MKTLISVPVVALFLSSLCLAQEFPDLGDLRELDSDDDGQISLSEFEDYLKAMFIRSDYNQDLKLNEEEQQRLLKNLKAGLSMFDRSKTRARLSDDVGDEDEVILPSR